MLLLMKEEAEQAYVYEFYCHARLENVIKYPITLLVCVCGALCELKHVQCQTNVQYTSTSYLYFACGMACSYAFYPNSSIPLEHQQPI